MAGYNQECRSRLIVDGFAFSFGQYEFVGRSQTFRVSAYRWRNTLLIDLMIIRYVQYLHLGNFHDDKNDK